jgi:hypothetical protein
MKRHLMGAAFLLMKYPRRKVWDGAYLDDQFTFAGEHAQLRVLRSALVLMKRHSAAVERTDECDKRHVFAIVCLVNYNLRAKDGCWLQWNAAAECNVMRHWRHSRCTIVPPPGAIQSCHLNESSRLLNPAAPRPYGRKVRIARTQKSATLLSKAR